MAFVEDSKQLEDRRSQISMTHEEQVATNHKNSVSDVTETYEMRSINLRAILGLLVCRSDLKVLSANLDRPSR